MVTRNENVNINIRERGTRTVTRRLDGLINKAEGATRAFRLMQNAIFVLGLAGVAANVVRFADVLVSTENRIRLVTNSIQELNGVQKQLFDLSRRSRADFEISAQIYARTALSVKTLGFEQKRLLQFTESLNQAVVLSGATAREANAALIQLAQGLASNRLSGDELRSVLEQLPFVADIIAESLGKTRGELRAFAKEGGITAKVVLDAFKDARVEIAEKFANTIPTVGQSLNVLKTGFLENLKAINDTTGATSVLATGILVLSANLDVLGLSILGVGAAYYSLKLSTYIQSGVVLIAQAFKYSNAVRAGNVVLETRVGLELTRAAFESKLAASGLRRLGRLNAAANLDKLRLVAARKLVQQDLDSIRVNVLTRRAIDSTTGRYVSYRAALEQTRKSKVRLAQIDKELLASNVFIGRSQKSLDAASARRVAASRAEIAAVTAYNSRLSRLGRRFPIITRFLTNLTGKLGPLTRLLQPIIAGFGAIAAVIGVTATAIVTGGVAIAGVLFAFRNDILVTNDRITSLGHVLRVFWSDLEENTRDFRKYAGESFAILGEQLQPFVDAWNTIAQTMADVIVLAGKGALALAFTDKQLQDARNLALNESSDRQLIALAGRDRSLPEPDTSFADYLKGLERELFFKRQTVNEQRILNTLKAAEKELGRELTERVGEGGNPGAFTEGDIIRLRVAREIFNERVKSFDEYLDKLRQENFLLGLSNRERRLATAQQKAIAEFTGGDPNIETPSSRISSARQLEINKINIEAREAILGKIDALNKETDAIGLSARGLAAYAAVREVANSVDRQLLPSDIDPIVAASNNLVDAQEAEARRLAFNDYIASLKEEQTVLGETNRRTRIRLALKEHEVALFSDRGYQIVSQENSLAEATINKSIRDRIALLNAEGRNLKLSALNRAINVALAEEQLKAQRTLTELEGQAVADAVIENFNDTERNKRLKSFQDYISAVDGEYRLLGLSNSEKRIELELAEAKIANNGKELEFWQEAAVVIREVLKQQKETNIAVEQQLENTQQSIDLLGLSNFQREIQIKLLRDEKAAIDGLTESQLNNLRQSYQQEQNITGQIAANSNISSLRERNQLALGTHPEIQSLRDNDIINGSDSPAVASAIASEIIRTQAASQLVLTQEQELAIAVEVRLAEAIKNTGNARESSKKTFEDYVRELQRENAELLVNSREREILNSIHKIENALRITLTQTQRDIVRTLREENAVLQVYRGLLDDIQEPQLAYADNVAALNKLHAEGIITSRKFTDSIRQQRIELLESSETFGDGFELGYQRIFTNIQTQNETVAGAITTAYGSSLDALTEFIQLGETSFKSVIQSLSADLLKLSLDKTFQALFSGIGNVFSNGAFNGGGINYGNTQPNAGNAGVSFGSYIGSLLGFQNGGSFTVGQGSGMALPGIDNRLVPLRLQDGEQVNITPRGGKGGNGNNDGNTYIFNVKSDSPETFSNPRTQSQIGAVLTQTIRNAHRNA